MIKETCKSLGIRVGRGRFLGRFGEQTDKIAAVSRLAELLDVGLQPGPVNPAVAPGDLLRTGDFQSLTILNHVDKFRRVEQGIVRSGVEPGRAASEQFHPQTTALEV